MKNSGLGGKQIFAVSILAMVASAAPSFALTAPALRLADNSGDVVTMDSAGVITFSGSCLPATCVTTTSSFASGSVTWTGTIGPFTVFSANGRTKPSIGAPSIDIGVGSVWTAAVGGTLTISWTDTGFEGSTPAFMNASTTFQAGSGSVVYTAYADDSNVPFGTGIATGTIGPVTTSGSTGILGLGPIANPFSMTNVEVITLTPNSTFVNDFSNQAAPYAPLRLSCPVASGQVGVPYSSSIGILGGVANYSFSIIAGSLPAGLVQNADGTITGIPTIASAYNFTAQVVDSSGFLGSDTITSHCSITIASPPPTLACPGILSGQAGSPYSSSLVAMGGSAPYTFSITAGSLPTGLFVDANKGAITGTPSAAGTFTFAASVLDSVKPKGNTSTTSCTMTITAPPPPMTLTCAATAGTIGAAYSSSLSATGGTAPYKFALAPGSGPLPTGLTLAPTGAITGTATAAGTFPYTFQVTDSSGNSISGTATKSCSIGIVNPQTSPLSVNCPLGTATAGVPYSSTVAVSGGVAPYTITVSAGSLPTGLTLNPTTTGGIVTGATITGTPTVAGTSGFTLKVVDSKGTVAMSGCVGTCATGGTSSVNFNSHLGNLGNSEPYAVSGVTLTAYGYNNSGSATALYGTNASGVQNDGLGLDAASYNQIDTTHFVQIDLSAALAAGATSGQIMISGLNQCQYGESYDIYGSNTLGSLGTLIVSAGTKDTTFFAIPSFGTYKYISVRAHSGNVLLSQITFTLPGTTCSITVAPAPVAKISMTKKANVTKVNPFQPVTYTYTVTNTGGFTLANVVVTDDNATPSYTGDDFTVGTVASLAPGASATLTATVIPPVSEGGSQQSWNGWGSSGWGYNNWGSNSSPAGTLICSKLPNGNYQVTYRQDPGQTDNTYGRGSSSSWGYQNRSFSDMLGGQAAEFKFLDANGTTVLDVATDYISKSSAFPSGYGTLGVKGGNGTVIKGDGSKVISCDTTLSRNLNKSSGFYKCTTDSPTSSDWDNVSGYTIVVDGKAFGAAGWGGVAIPECHNQHSIQWGCDDQKVSPVSSSATNTATATATGNGVTVTAKATATVQIDASSSGWSKCDKY